MKNIPPLYHWAPVSARESILKQGLLPLTPSRGGAAVCLASSPLDAWALSGSHRSGVLEWDLYEVHVADTPVSRIKHWGRWTEWRIPRQILPQGVVWLATRCVQN